MNPEFYCKVLITNPQREVKKLKLYNPKFKYTDKHWKIYNGEDIKDYPSLTFVPRTSLIIDKTARNIESARYIIERKILPRDMINTLYKIYGIEVNDKQLDDYEFIDHIDHNRQIEDMFMAGSLYDVNIQDEVYHIVKEKNAEVFEVYERWEITIFINGKKYWKFNQLWAWKKCPYKDIRYTDVPNSIYWPWVWTLTKPVQDVYDWILNARMDNVKLANNKVFLHVTSLDPIMQDDDYIDIEPWMILHMREPNAIQELPISDIKQWPIVESDNLQKLAQETIWASWYQLWTQQKVERSAFWVEALQTASLNRLKPIIQSISDAMAFVAKYWLVLSLDMTDDITFEKVIWKKPDLSVQDVIEDVDFEFNMTAMKLQSMSVKMGQVMQLLQTSPALVDAAWKPLVDIKPLYKFMLQWLWLDEEAILSKEDVIAAMKEWQEIQQALAGSQWMGWMMPQQGWWEPVDVQWLLPAPWVQWWEPVV